MRGIILLGLIMTGGSRTAPTDFAGKTPVGDGFPVPHLTDTEITIGARTATGEETSPYNRKIEIIGQ